MWPEAACEHPIPTWPLRGTVQLQGRAVCAPDCLAGRARNLHGNACKRLVPCAVLRGLDAPNASPWPPSTRLASLPLQHQTPCLVIVVRCSLYLLLLPLAVLSLHHHRAPELVLKGHASRASDVFAYGVLLYEMVSNNRAFAGTKLMQPVWVLSTASALYKAYCIHCRAYSACVTAGCA